MFIITHMETETKMLDKYMRKMFPFIIRVEEVEPVRVRRYSKDRDFKLELRIVLLPLTSPTLCTGFYIRNYQGYRYCSSKNFMRHKMKISEHN